MFIDARKLGTMATRVLRELSDADIARIAGTYHAWRGDEGAGEYNDVPGFCKATSLEEIRNHGHVLTPGRYVGAEAAEDDGEPFEEKMQRLTALLREQQTEGARLEVLGSAAKGTFDLATSDLDFIARFRNPLEPGDGGRFCGFADAALALMGRPVEL